MGIITTREKEIMNWVILGFSNREISEKLGIKKDTVKAHLTNIYRKLEVSKRIPAIAEVIKLGIINISKNPDK